jgi:hypothetical protein
MSNPSPIQVHVLVDLEWRPQAGGQQLCWLNLAEAARGVDGLALTIHAQGESELDRVLHPNARLLLHKPVFSTRKLPFLRVPAHTDLARFHPALARALEGADVIHTTDAFFAYARTAEKVAGQRRLPLTHSIHTDTVSYSGIFTRGMLERNLGGVGRSLDGTFAIARRVQANMAAKLRRHESQCRFVLASCERDMIDAA